jgi:hypothetical protein
MSMSILTHRVLPVLIVLGAVIALLLMTVGGAEAAPLDKWDAYAYGSGCVADTMWDFLVRLQFHLSGQTEYARNVCSKSFY